MKIGTTKGGRNVNSLRHADDRTLFAENKEDLKILIQEENLS